ncbi:hypothetical protein RhiirA1_483769, partial [Rhizophagus irregularis]
WLSDPVKNGSGRYAELPNYIVKLPDHAHIIRKEQRFEIGSFTFKAVFTPGHSPGSISYIFDEDGFAISIHDKLLTLDEKKVAKIPVKKAITLYMLLMKNSPPFAMRHNYLKVYYK